MIPVLVSALTGDRKVAGTGVRGRIHASNRVCPFGWVFRRFRCWLRRRLRCRLWRWFRCRLRCRLRRRLRRWFRRRLRRWFRRRLRRRLRRRVRCRVRRRLHCRLRCQFRRRVIYRLRVGQRREKRGRQQQAQKHCQPSSENRLHGFPPSSISCGKKRVLLAR